MQQFSRLREYQKSSTFKSTWQVVSTFTLYLALVGLMYATAHASVWLTLLMSIFASGLIVRIFMLQHDCGHGSLFPGRRMNSIVGSICSLVTLTPFAYWRRLHARHHGSWNDLDGRGIPADFFSDCLTVSEYASLGSGKRWLYRVSHNPLLVHFLLPPVIFLLLYRVPFDTPAKHRREQLSVLFLNVSLLIVVTGLILTFGVRSVVLVHLPALVLAAVIGIWLFSVQHRFEEAQWSSKEDWTFSHAALHGTSYLRLPAVLRWFSANIGLHHVHHLRPAIPNYHLQACHEACKDVTGAATVLTLRQALRAPTFALWDEDLKRMIPFPA